MRQGVITPFDHLDGFERNIQQAARPTGARAGPSGTLPDMVAGPWSCALREDDSSNNAGRRLDVGGGSINVSSCRMATLAANRQWHAPPQAGHWTRLMPMWRAAREKRTRASTCLSSWTRQTCHSGGCLASEVGGWHTAAGGLCRKYYAAAIHNDGRLQLCTAEDCKLIALGRLAG